MILTSEKQQLIAGIHHSTAWPHRAAEELIIDADVTLPISSNCFPTILYIQMVL